MMFYSKLKLDEALAQERRWICEHMVAMAHQIQEGSHYGLEQMIVDVAPLGSPIRKVIEITLRAAGHQVLEADYLRGLDRDEADASALADDERTVLIQLYKGERPWGSSVGRALNLLVARQLVDTRWTITERGAAAAKWLWMKEQP